jgi:hypothetical protein
MLAAETENRVKAEGDTAVNPYPAKTRTLQKPHLDKSTENYVSIATES